MTGSPPRRRIPLSSLATIDQVAGFVTLRVRPDHFFITVHSTGRRMQHPAEYLTPPALQPGDPAPVELINPDGRAPLLLVCDHAGNAVPHCLAGLGLPADELCRHIAWDPGAAALTRCLAERLDAAAVLAAYSRLVIDVNRAPGDPDSMPPVSDGTPVPGNQDIDAAAADWRRRTLFQPYHQTIADRIVALRRRGPVPAVIAVHSFTPQLRGGLPRPWQVGLLWDRDPRLPLPLLEGLRARPGLRVGDNVPYCGRRTGFTTKVHAAAAGLPHVSLELRQDLLTTGDAVNHWADWVAEALAVILADPAVHQVAYF